MSAPSQSPLIEEGEVRAVPMTKAAKAAALRQGQRRYQAKLRREAKARVRAYQRWLAAGSDLRKIPRIPTDNDYKIARGEK